MSCSSFKTQVDIANNIFTPAGAIHPDIGLCRIDESNEKEGILMIRNYIFDRVVWDTVEVSHLPILSNEIELRLT